MFVMMACFCKRRVHLFFHLKIRCVGARLTADIEAKGKAAIILHRRNDLVAVYRLAAPRRGTLTADAYGEAAAGGWLEDVMAAQSRSDFAFRESGFDLGADELTFGRMSGSLRLHFFL